MSQSIVIANALLDQQLLGIGLASPLSTDPATGDFLKLSGDDNLEACIADLLSTRVGERLMNEDFGSLFPSALFGNLEGLLHVLPTQTIQTINQFEPRVTNVVASATQIDTSVIEVDITYVVRTTGAKGNLVWPFYLQANAASIG